MKFVHLIISFIILYAACSSPKEDTGTATLFARNNLVAWCIVPFDSMERTPEERAVMLEELGIKQLAYDWRLKHLPSFPEEIKALKNHNIKLKAVWMWVDPASEKILDETNEHLLKIIKDNNAKTDLWIGFGNRYFEGFSDDEKLERAVTAVEQIEKRASDMGCTISLYNHGDWFGEPVNQIRIIEKIGSKDIGIVYNFHHAHSQINEFPELLQKMLPYLNTVNLNGMKAEGPKIITPGQGDHELEMLKTLKQSGYKGAVGIIGHIEDADVKVVLQENIDGLKSLLKEMNDTRALSTY